MFKRKFSMNEKRNFLDDAYLEYSNNKPFYDNYVFRKDNGKSECNQEEKAEEDTDSNRGRYEGIAMFIVIASIILSFFILNTF